jgi:hypothetical protein
VLALVHLHDAAVAVGVLEDGGDKPTLPSGHHLGQLTAREGTVNRNNDRPRAGALVPAWAPKPRRGGGVEETAAGRGDEAKHGTLDLEHASTLLTSSSARAPTLWEAARSAAATKQPTGVLLTRTTLQPCC